jgi:hypothetical protein
MIIRVNEDDEWSFQYCSYNDNSHLSLMKNKTEYFSYVDDKKIFVFNSKDVLSVIEEEILTEELKYKKEFDIKVNYVVLALLSLFIVTFGGIH